MLHSPVPIEAVDGDAGGSSFGTDVVAECWPEIERHGSMHSRVFARLRLVLAFIALGVIWLIAGNPFEDGAEP